MIYDNEECWEIVPSRSATKFVYRHTELPGFYRVIDRESRTVEFSDVERISVIHDINKVLIKEDDKELNMKRYLPMINEVLDKLQPITLPYMRSEHIAYIEAFPGYNETEDDVLGILYFRDKGLTEDKDVMIPAKKFFRILPIVSACRYEEIDMETYMYLKRNYFRRQDKNVGKNNNRNFSKS